MSVPCNGCTACCRYKDIMHLKPDYITVNKDGDCIHLTPDGCSIHSMSPKGCQEFDCTEFMALAISGMIIPARLLKATANRIKRGQTD